MKVADNERQGQLLQLIARIESFVN